MLVADVTSELAAVHGCGCGSDIGRCMAKQTPRQCSLPLAAASAPAALASPPRAAEAAADALDRVQ